MIEKEKIKNILERLAQVVLLNSSFVTNSGLFYGQAGALIFAYSYGKYTNNCIYENYADELALSLSKKSSFQSDGIYTNGIAGIGWAFDFLTKNDFIELGDKFYNDINEKVILNHSDLKSINIENAGLGVYLCTQLTKLEGKWYDDLDTMLRLEKLISLIDCFEIEYDKTFSHLNKPRELAKLLKHKKYTYVSNTLYNYSKLFQLVNKTSKASIYPTVSKNLLNKAIINTPEIITSVLEVLKSIELVRRPILNEVYLSFLELCSVYLQTSVSSNHIKSLIAESCNVFDNIISKSEIKSLDEFGLNQKFRELDTLSKINNYLKNDSLEELINSKWEEVIASFFAADHQEKSFSAYFKDDKNKIKIGLADGLSHAGMTMLSYLGGDTYANWREALLLD
jgi:hypothetical protein